MTGCKTGSPRPGGAGWSRGLLLAAGVGLALGCAGVGPLPPAEELDQGDPAYVIGPGDTLLVSVWKNPDLTVTVPVRTDGMISVPLLDDVPAAGLRPQELKEVLTESFSEFIAAPDVTVVVQSMGSKTVTVLGGVARSGGAVPVTVETRVLDAIARMGGFTTWARRDQVRILRRTDDGVVEYRFNYRAFLAGDAPESNFVLKPGDTVVVPD